MIIYQIASIALIIGGLVLLLTAVFPIVSYEVLTAPRFKATKERLLSPVSRALPGRVVDLTRASNWFEGEESVATQPISSNVRYYTVSIPKLRIDQAAAEIAGEDLSKSLIHYKGTALPGRVGNTVIFGHSILPQFFNPKNYLTIFSTLPTLRLGDEVIVDYDQITYRFIVREMFEVSPTDIQVLAQPNDRPRLTLITCVPPGTYLRRLVVRAELASPKL